MFFIVFGREHKNKLELLADRTSIIQPDNIWSWFSPTGAGVSNLPLSLLFNEVTRSPSDTIGSGFMSNLFDGTVLSSLDKQAAIHRNGPIATGGNEAANLGEYQEWPGIVPIDAAHLDKIWRDVETEKKAMLYQKEEYERARTEEIETRKKLAGQVSERARLGREREARECLLRTQEEEREQRHQHPLI